MTKQDTTASQSTVDTLGDVYGKTKKGIEASKFFSSEIQNINDALERREKESAIFNGIVYSSAYEYNQKKGINYAPPKSKDDSEVSLGLVHEKIVSFVAIFLKYVFKKDIKCYDNNGKMIDGLGEVYEMAIDFSQRAEKFTQKIALIYWETFVQGDAFVLEDWEVKTITRSIAIKDKKELNIEEMDFTYEFLEGLDYKDGKKVQTRKAVSRVLDGRNVILEDPELDSGIQDQEALTYEELISRSKAEDIYGTLAMWDKVPKNLEDIKKVVGDKVTLFDSKRLKDPEKQVLVHRRWNKALNRFMIYINGVGVLPYNTPLAIFYPRYNYPMSQFSAERVTGSAYSRSIPAKTKFNADYADFVIKMLARLFEQDVDPALLVKGKYTLVKDIFDAGKRTHGVTTDMYEFADKERKGLTSAHFSFLELLKGIQESQTVNPTTSGELSTNTTALEIATVDQNQKDKLGYLLDGLINGFMDMAMRRAETIESKYTIKQRETVVDGKKVNVYQNFTVSSSGVQNVVEFNDELQTNDLYDFKGKRAELFEKAYNKPVEYFLVNPKALRDGTAIIDIEIKPERIKDSALQLVTMKDEFDWLLATFPNANRDEMQKEYLEVSGRSDEMFIPAELAELQNAGQTEGGGGVDTSSLKPALRQQMLGVNK